MKKGKKKTLKGSVLFTVVSVMALLIIFLTGTLALASATNNRAHKSYASSQASYTARAAIQSFTEAMMREEQIVAAVQNLSGTDVMHPEVIINDSTLGVVGYYDNTGNWVNDAITVQLDGKDYAYFDDEILGNGWHEVDVVRISATCRVGKEEETVSAVIKKAQSGQQGSAGSSKLNGLNSVGAGYAPAGALISGGLGLGLRDNVRRDFEIRNSTTIETTVTFINGSLAVKTGSININVKKPDDPDASMPYSETIINGNLYVPNDPFIKIDYTMDSDFNQKEIPYLYVDGAIVAKTPKQFVTGNKQPYNIFAGTFAMGENGNEINLDAADLYLMDEYKVNEYYTVATDNGQSVAVRKGDSYLGRAGGSNLYKWTDSVYNKTDVQNTSTGGNVYAKGNLTLHLMTVNGDVRVEGDCILKDSVTIKGDLVVRGTLMLENPDKLTVNGTIYCNNVVNSTTGGTIITGYTRVENTYHGPTRKEIEDCIKVESGKREYYCWNPEDHQADGNFYDISGANAGRAGGDLIFYYSWENDYDPNMTMYKSKIDGSYEYRYPDEDGLSEEEYDNLGRVQDVINRSLTNNYVPGSDADVQAAVDRFVNKGTGKHTWETQVNGVEVHEYYVTKTIVGFDTAGAPIFRETSVPTTEEYYWFDPATGSYLTEAEKWIDVPEYYTKKDINGNETDIHAATKWTYYRNSDGAEVSEYEATHNMGASTNFTAEDFDNYPGRVAYPENMTREKIYGRYDPVTGAFDPADSSTKIVTTLQEVRRMMDLDPETGDLNTDSYPTRVPANQNVSEPAYTDTGNTAKNGNVWDTVNNCIVENCTLSGLLKGDVTIKPGGGSSDKLWILLDNVTIDGNNGSGDLIVDTSSGGEVYFMIKGNLTLTASAIRNRDFVTGCTIEHTTDFGITFYGEPGSKLQVVNTPSTLTGSFKCPETIFLDNFGGKYEVNYRDEYGKVWTGKPSIAGNGLFKEIQGQTNEFAIYNTASGGSSGNPSGGGGIKTSRGYYEIGYFAGS